MDCAGIPVTPGPPGPCKCRPSLVADSRFHRSRALKEHARRALPVHSVPSFSAGLVVGLTTAALMKIRRVWRKKKNQDVPQLALDATLSALDPKAMAASTKISQAVEEGMKEFSKSGDYAAVGRGVALLRRRLVQQAAEEIRQGHVEPRLIAELLVDAVLNRAFRGGEKSFYSELWLLDEGRASVQNIHTEKMADDLNQPDGNVTISHVVVDERVREKSGATRYRPLFVQVQPYLFTRPTFLALLEVFEVFHRRSCQGPMQDYSLQDRQSIERFLDVVDLTPVMRRAREEVEKYEAGLTDQQWREHLWHIWFQRHPSSPKCGFEHVFIGEATEDLNGRELVGGLHNWVKFYLEERRGAARYLGPRYKGTGKHDAALNPYFVSGKFTWDLNGKHLAAAPAQASAQAPSSSTWAPDAAQQVPAAAPATSAAKVLLGTAQAQAEKLARQKARAKRRGQRAVRWGQMSGLNAQNFALPGFIRQIGSAQNEQSVLVVNNRDKRIQSPFQGWLLDEILVNAQSGISVTSDRQLIRSPSKGYHFNLFYVRTLDGFKFTLVGSMTSYATVPCAKWDGLTGQVMAHQAFQPFRWPMMTDESSTWVDVKIKVEGGLLVHMELRGYRSDQDMTVQLNYVNDSMIMDLKDTLFVPSVVVTVFQGWRVIATSFEVGGRLYACSEGGKVVALDFPLCHFEVRMTATSSADSIGMDADRLEFRFRSAADKIDVSCSQIVVPSTWLVVSRVSGPTLIKNAHWCCDHHARIEGPDQTLQLSQLAGVHAHWTASVEAASIEETRTMCT
eukprot:s1508_g7.t1